MSKNKVASVKTLMLNGIEVVPITVEISVEEGSLPGLSIVGCPDTIVNEARLLVSCALKASGFYYSKQMRVTAAVLPMSVRKHEPGNIAFAIACAYLRATGQVDPHLFEHAFCVGDLALDRVMPARSTFAFGEYARRCDMGLVCACGSDELRWLEGLEIACIGNIGDLRHPEFMHAELLPENPRALSQPKGSDLADHAFPRHAVRALAIAAAGGHNLMLQGPRDSRVNELAERIGTILPPLGEEKALEAACIHSAARFEVDGLFRGEPLVRIPHHSTTLPGLIGGGSSIMPGEVTLAHNGVLVFEDMQEWSPSALQAMRQPMSDGHVCICRSGVRASMPADFTLVATCGTCPCGYFGSILGTCRCSEHQIAGYQDRIAGPLRDEFDLWVQVGEIPGTDALDAQDRIDSAQVREMVADARERAARRDGGRKLQDMTLEELVGTCGVSDEVLRGVMSMRPGMTDAELMRLLRVSRTIADLDGDETVTYEQLTEALYYIVSI